MRVFNSPLSISEAVGESLGTSEWMSIIQDDVNAFARLTRDLQWIHLDVERARSSPFGGTIAHGHFILALVPTLLGQTHRVAGARMEINYGLNKVRFPSPTRVGARIRLSATLDQAEVSNDWAHMVVSTVIEADDSDKPVCVADTIARYYF